LIHFIFQCNINNFISVITIFPPQPFLTKNVTFKPFSPLHPKNNQQDVALLLVVRRPSSSYHHPFQISINPGVEFSFDLVVDFVTSLIDRGFLSKLYGTASVSSGSSLYDHALSSDGGFIGRRWDWFAMVGFSPSTTALSAPGCLGSLNVCCYDAANTSSCWCTTCWFLILSDLLGMHFSWFSFSTQPWCLMVILVEKF